ncbi:MAG TPA: hypothetical protein DCQ98_12965 [Planctomycetaceae bacterium]|nr:hypothetical protein [Planctomycetaceae bacterium]HRF01335.1 biopolymer transporter ExbD [Pirellulaceae bacterium]
MRLARARHREAGRIELSMTAMIDVVFLLLIFFLVTTSFTKAERQLRPVIQVQQREATRAAAGRLEPAVVEVLPSSAAASYKVGGRELASVAELTRLLDAFDNKDEGAFVMVHDGAPFDRTAAALQACRTSGFPSVSYVPAAPGP